MALTTVLVRQTSLVGTKGAINKDITSLKDLIPTAAATRHLTPTSDNTTLRLILTRLAELEQLGPMLEVINICNFHCILHERRESLFEFFKTFFKLEEFQLENY